MPESAWQCRRCRRWRFDPWVGKIPGVGIGNPLQYSCLEKISWTEEPGVWGGAIVHGVAESDTAEQTHTHTHTHTHTGFMHPFVLILFITGNSNPWVFC